MTTMADVARIAQVSTSTVSHVLNGTRKVNDETKARVEQAIDDLGYRQNTAASMLAGGRSRTIGLAISGLTNPYFGPLLHAIERHVSEAGYMLLLGDTHDEAAMEQRVISSLLARRVDGLIVAPSNGFMRLSAESVRQAEIPLVVIDRGIPFECDQLTPENFQSTKELTEHLLSHGHRRIAVLRGIDGLDSSSQRFEGFRAALVAHEAGPDDRLVLEGKSNEAVAEAAVNDLLSSGTRPDAILSLNNAMTIGALRAIASAGLSIPRDIAFACYDDFEWSDLFSPGLTAVKQEVELMGIRAVDLLVSRISGDEQPHQFRSIDTTLHLRTSCGCSP